MARLPAGAKALSPRATNPALSAHQTARQQVAAQALTQTQAQAQGQAQTQGHAQAPGSATQTLHTTNAAHAKASASPQASATVQAPAPSTREIAHKLRAAAAASLRRRRDAIASRLGQAADSLHAGAASAQPQQEGAAPGTAASKPSIRAAAALPAWRVAVPIAVLSSALMAGTATIMASLAAPQAAGGWIEAPTNTASLAPCLVGHALSKQSWFPRAATGCWPVPQPQSVSASVGRTVRQLTRVRFL